MNQITAKPGHLKQANLSLIYKIIKSRGTATRAEIAVESGISSTTVRSLLGEMLERGEIESIGHDESSGGRKAERYRFLPECYHSAVFCICGHQIHALLVNGCSEIVDQSVLESADDNYEPVILPFLDALMEKYRIKAIGLGVPGIVDGNFYWKMPPGAEELCRIDLGQTLAGRYPVPVILENDLNATAIGIAQCYRKEFPEEEKNHINMAYVHFEKGCISAGFISEGRIIRGWNNFAGELSLTPVDGTTRLDDFLDEDTEDSEYIKSVTGILSWICSILNPEYIALGGPALRKKCIGSVSSMLSSLVPRQMMAEILYSEDTGHDYFNGMAYLTTAQIAPSFSPFSQ